MAAVIMQLPDDLESELERMAQETGRTRGFLVIQAIREFVTHEAWQLAEIRSGLAEADSGDFATEEELAALKRKWSRDAG